MPHVIRAFEAVGIAGNVTVPHKVAVAQLLIRLTGSAQELGAVNTFYPEGGRLVGDNTDVPGLLAALEPPEIERLLGAHELRSFTPKTIVEREALKRELEEVRKRGIAFDDGEFDAEVRCVAVPVRDFAGRASGAVGISGPIWRLSLQALQDKSARVRAAAAELSAELGARAAA